MKHSMEQSWGSSKRSCTDLYVLVQLSWVRIIGKYQIVVAAVALVVVVVVFIVMIVVITTSNTLN